MADETRAPDPTAAVGGTRAPDPTAAVDAAEAPDPTAATDASRFEARVLRSFVRDGRLTTIPAQDRKRQVILRWLLATRFPESDGAWQEREVNMRLALVHPDVAALRRYLVDAGLMTRSSGEYRRVLPTTPGAMPAGTNRAGS